MDELWRPIPGFPGYEISNLGNGRRLDKDEDYVDAIGRRVKRCFKGRDLIPQLGRSRYYEFNLRRNGQVYRRYVHRMVAEAFLGPIPEGMVVLHGPNGKLDNRASELRIGTVSENMLDRHRDGTAPTGEANASSKLTAAKVRAIRADTRPHREIAADYGITRSNVGLIKQGKTWKHVA